MSTEQIRSLSSLEPHVAILVADWLRLCNAKGVPVLIYETRRTEQRQNMLYAKGRTTPGSIVTNARGGESFHQYGRAIDAVPWDLRRGSDHKELDWNPFYAGTRSKWEGGDNRLSLLDPRWRTMVEAADAVGLEWAGRWTGFREYVHWQVSNGMTIQQIALEARTA